MHRSTAKFTLIASLAVMASAPLAACKKEGAAGSKSDTLAYLPKDAAMVATASMEKARSSELFKKNQERIMGQLPPDLAKFKATCGIDPLADLDSMVVGIGGDPQADGGTVIVMEGKIDKAKVEACILKIGKEETGADVTPEVKGKVTAYPALEMATYFPAEHTLVLAKGGAGAVATLEAIAGGANVKANKPVMDMVGKVDSDSTFSIAGVIPASMAGPMASMGGSPQSLHASVKMDSGIDVDAAIMFANEEEAKQMSMLASMGLSAAKGQPPLEGIVDNIKIVAEGATLKINADLTGEQIQTISDMAGGPTAGAPAAPMGMDPAAGAADPTGMDPAAGTADPTGMDPAAGAADPTGMDPAADPAAGAAEPAAEDGVE